MQTLLGGETEGGESIGLARERLRQGWGKDRGSRRETRRAGGVTKISHQQVAGNPARKNAAAKRHRGSEKLFAATQLDVSPKSDRG